MPPTVQHIKDDLRKTYRQIAQDFSESRSHPWPEFEVFEQYIPEGSKVLDLGCGNGRVYSFLKERLQVDYTGVDFCPELLDIARKNHPQVEFIEQDITELDLDRLYDRILSVAAFHHVPSRRLRKKTLRLMFDRLEDDGLLLLSVWNLWQWKYWKQHAKAWLRWMGSFFREDPRDLFIPFGKQRLPRYYHAFLPFELKRLLSSTGFHVQHFQVSRHNYLFICSKTMLKGSSEPALAKHQHLGRAISKPSTVATSSPQKS